jgi:hypothetical protein
LRGVSTRKVLNNLKKRLQWLRDHAQFEVVISAVIGACPPEEANEVVSFVRQLGFGARVLLVHDSQGQLKLSSEDLKAFEQIVEELPKRWPEFSGYAKNWCAVAPHHSNVAPAAATLRG